MRAFHVLTALVLGLALVLQGCAASRSGAVYSREQARQTQQVRMGVVEDVRAVQIEGTSGTVGTLAGAATGAVAGSAVGQGRGSAIAAIAGAVIGGVAGAAAEEGMTRKAGVEVTVRLESGEIIAVVQEAQENEVFRVGSRVKVVTDYEGVTRVSNLGAPQGGAAVPGAQSQPAYP